MPRLTRAKLDYNVTAEAARISRVGFFAVPHFSTHCSPATSFTQRSTRAALLAPLRMEWGGVVTGGHKQTVQTSVDQYFPAVPANHKAAREEATAWKAQALKAQEVNKSTTAALAATTAALAALDDGKYILQSELAAIAAGSERGPFSALSSREPEELEGELELLLGVLADKIEMHHGKVCDERRDERHARKELSSVLGTTEAALFRAHDNIGGLQVCNSIFLLVVLALLALVYRIGGVTHEAGVREGVRKERLRTSAYTVLPQPHFTKDSTVPESAGSSASATDVLARAPPPGPLAEGVILSPYAEFSIWGSSTSTCDDQPQSQHGDVLEGALAPQDDHASRINSSTEDGTPSSTEAKPDASKAVADKLSATKHTAVARSVEEKAAEDESAVYKSAADKSDADAKPGGDKAAAVEADADDIAANAKAVEAQRTAPPTAAQTAAPYAAPGTSRTSRSEDGADSCRATNGTERSRAADKTAADTKIIEAPRAAPPFAARTAAPRASAPRRAPTATPSTSPTTASRAAPPSAAQTTAPHTVAPGGAPAAPPGSSRPTPAPTRRPHQPATAPSTPWLTCEPLPDFELRVHWISAQGNKLADLASKSAPD